MNDRLILEINAMTVLNCEMNRKRRKGGRRHVCVDEQKGEMNTHSQSTYVNTERKTEKDRERERERENERTERDGFKMLQ